MNKVEAKVNAHLTKKQEAVIKLAANAAGYGLTAAGWRASTRTAYAGKYPTAATP